MFSNVLLLWNDIWPDLWRCQRPTDQISRSINSITCKYNEVLWHGVFEQKKTAGYFGRSQGIEMPSPADDKGRKQPDEAQVENVI